MDKIAVRCRMIVRSTQWAMVLNKDCAIWPHSAWACGSLDDSFWRSYNVMNDTCKMKRLTQHISATESLILRLRRSSQPNRCLVRLRRKSDFSAGTRPPECHGAIMTLTESSTKGCCKICSITPLAWSNFSHCLRWKKMGRSRWIGTLPDATESISDDKYNSDVTHRFWRPVV